jgi:uncharacterized MnhB-related membrane protein
MLGKIYKTYVASILKSNDYELLKIIVNPDVAMTEAATSIRKHPVLSLLIKFAVKKK